MSWRQKRGRPPDVASLPKRTIAARCTVTPMTDWPAEWRPVNPDEAQQYMDAHQDGSGDPELIEECESFLGPQHQVFEGGGQPNLAHRTPFPTLPEDPEEEKGAD
jgi:hypothetical protein